MRPAWNRPRAVETNDYCDGDRRLRSPSGARARPTAKVHRALGYGVGQAAEGIKNYAFASCLLFYYTSLLGLSGSLAGAALMVALVGLSFIVFIRYDLTRERHAAIRARLDAAHESGIS